MIVLAFSEQPQLLYIISMYFLADLQMVSISLRVLARPNVSKLPDLYRQLGTDYDDRVLPSLCNEVCGGPYFIAQLTTFVGTYFTSRLPRSECPKESLSNHSEKSSNESKH